MGKYISIILVLVLTACAQGTKEIEKQHWAYTHQVLEQSKKEKVAIANVGDYENNQYLNPIYSVKLVLKNCNYANEWTDDNFYSWTGSLADTNKSYSYTTVMGANKTIPSYIGDCSKQDIKKVSCYLWQDENCIKEQEKLAEEK